MGVYKKIIITDVGRSLLAEAVAGQKNLNFSKAKTSSHIYPEGTDFRKMTALLDIMQEAIPSNVKVINDTTVSARVLFGNETVTKAYLIQNIGLYAMDGEQEILFSVSQAVTPDQMPAYSSVAPSSFIYDISIPVSQASNINLTVNPAGVATAKDILDLDKKKIDASGGDISNTVVESFETSSEEFPVPEPGEDSKTLWGKVKKFAGDMKDWIKAHENEVEITLPASGWSGSAPYTQTVDVPGIKATDKVQLMSAVKKDTPAETAKTWEKMAGMIKAGETLDGQVAFYCLIEKPTEDFNIKLVGVSVNE